MADHFIPFRRSDVVAMCAEGAVPPADAAGFRDLCALLNATLHFEFHQRLERLKDLYAPFDPTSDTRPLKPFSADELATRERELVAELEGVLGKANYVRISQDELNQALREESVFKVQLHTELADFAQVIMHARSLRTRTEVLSSWFGLRRRAIEVAYYERVALYVRFQDEAHFAAKHPDPRARAKALTRIVPAATVLKLFQNIPKADLEMLLPNVDVRMKPSDIAVMGGTALLGSIGVVLKLLPALVFVVFMVLWWLGIREQQPDPALVAAQLAALAVGGFALVMYLVRQYGRFKNRKIQFMKALADSLYFRNLDNNAGVFHHLIDAAEEEEGKEAVLAWAFLAQGEATAEELDRRVEAWFRERWKVELDFEVEDGLGKLERLGLAARVSPEAGAAARWRATPLPESLRRLDERWDAFFRFATPAAAP